jgi:HAD superfamily hydrolase (TIGR01509 family)
MTEQPLLQAVVFDLDGLMFNTEELYDDVGEILLQRRGCHYTAELKREIMGRPARVGLKIMIEWHDLEATVEQLQTETEEIFAEILPTRLRALPGLEALLRALESVPVPKAIATSSGRAYTRTVLSQFDYAPRFQFVLTGEDVREGKPEPEVYLTAAERLGVPPSALMVLEDSENGCRAGVSAGAFTVAVPGPHSREHDFRGVALVANGLADPRIYRALRLAVPV